MVDCGGRRGPRKSITPACLMRRLDSGTPAGNAMKFPPMSASSELFRTVVPIPRRTDRLLAPRALLRRRVLRSEHRPPLYAQLTQYNPLGACTTPTLSASRLSTSWSRGPGLLPAAGALTRKFTIPSRRIATSRGRQGGRTGHNQCRSSQRSRRAAPQRVPIPDGRAPPGPTSTVSSGVLWPIAIGRPGTSSTGGCLAWLRRPMSCGAPLTLRARSTRRCR